MLGKKGVSPLIATVLLLAFAVALATVFIQIDWFESCNVEIDKINGQQRVCYNNQTKNIELFINNKDSNNVVRFKITASGNNGVKNSEHALNIGSKEQDKLFIEYDPESYGELVKINIFPMMNVSNKIKECELKEEITMIPLCP